MKKLKRVISAVINVLQGYNARANRQKFDLIHRTFTSIMPYAKSFADLGGVWNVNAAYTEYTLRNFLIERAILVDTDFPPGLNQRLSRWNQLQVIKEDFTSQTIANSIENVDVIFLFDVLLHQAHPHWDEVLARYSQICSSMIIFNQQWIRSTKSVRLTNMPLEEYLLTVPNQKGHAYREYFAHRDEIHPKFQKRYIDIHNMWQWGITDKDLRSTMSELGFHEAFSANFGRFSDLASFENHAFVFVRNHLQQNASNSRALLHNRSLKLTEPREDENSKLWLNFLIQLWHLSVGSKSDHFVAAA